MNDLEKKIAREGIEKAIALLGSQERLADKCGVKQQAVSLWLKQGYVPVKKALLVEKATNGAVTRITVCPFLKKFF
jgi:DNA-binding transcriptional regulator YdaS (Cro superfamily)